VREDETGKVLAFGENTDNYDPVVLPGETLHIEDDMPVIENPKHKRLQEIPSFNDYFIAWAENNTVALDKFKSDWVKTKQKHPV
jgi:hypothetical protein